MAIYSGLDELLGFYGELAAVQMIASFPLAMECRVTQVVDLQSNSFFIAEIVNIYREDRYMTGGQPDHTPIRPFLLTMPDNHYWALGECIGQVWDVGKKMRKELK